MDIIFEVNGSDVAAMDYRTSSLYELLQTAKQIAQQHQRPLSDVSLRFVAASEEATEEADDDDLPF